jgi:hypothetical protein
MYEYMQDVLSTCMQEYPTLGELVDPGNLAGVLVPPTSLMTLSHIQPT